MNAPVAKHRSSRLERRLAEWAKEWGGGKHGFEPQGSSWLASVIKWHGRPPTGLGYDGSGSTAADEVQEAVEALQRQKNGWAPACVLRSEYFSGATKHEKLQRLERIGIRVDESGYSRHLRIAKVHVAAWLKIPFDVPRENDVQEEIATLEYLLDVQG